MIGSVEESSQIVAESSEQISGASQNLAESATNQAQSVSMLLEENEQVVEMIQSTAKGMQGIHELTDTAGRRVLEEKQKMAEVLASMEEIKSRSEEIKNIIGTMDQIAGQTNLLALNASIEAARAGSMGAGFAVVAGEVANLADQSQAASQSIAELIWSTIDMVKEGDTKVRETVAHLEEIIAISRDIIHNVETVFAGTRTETEAIARIREGVNDISNMVLTSSAASQANKRYGFFRFLGFVICYRKRRCLPGRGAFSYVQNCQKMQLTYKHCRIVCLIGHFLLFFIFERKIQPIRGHVHGIW